MLDAAVAFWTRPSRPRWTAREHGQAPILLCRPSVRICRKNGWKPWTEEELQELRTFAQLKLPKEVIGLRLGRSPAAIVQRAWQERIVLSGRRAQRAGDGNGEPRSLLPGDVVMLPKGQIVSPHSS